MICQRSACGPIGRCMPILFGLVLLAGCGRSFDKMGEARTAYALRGEGSIVIAAIDEPDLPGFVDGVRLALDEINAKDGGLLGRRLSLLVMPGGDEIDNLRPTIRRIAADARVSAVLGHRDSTIAVPASVVYNAARVLFLPPFATEQQLTIHGFRYVLRMLPDNLVMASQSANLARLFGYRRMVLLHSRDDYARELAFLFDDAARREEIEIVFRGSFFNAEENYRGLLGQLNGVDFDAVYLSTETESGARVLRQMRELGLHQPVIGSDRLNFGSLIQAVGQAGDRTIVPIVYGIQSSGARNAQFIAAFIQAYQQPPNQNAAQGYDSMQLLAATIVRARSTDPQVLATTAHHAPPWAGLTGIYAFDTDGNLYGKSYSFQILRFGRWVALPQVTLPYLLSRFGDYQREVALEQEAAPVTEAAIDDPRARGAPTPAAELEQTRSDAPAGAENSVVAGADADAPGVRAMPSAGEDAIEAAEPPAPALDLAALSDRRMDRAMRNQIWLALAQELLEFKRLALVVQSTGEGDTTLALARQVAAQRGFDVVTCALPAVMDDAQRGVPQPEPERGPPDSPPDMTAADPNPSRPAGSPDAREEPSRAWAISGATPLEKAALTCWSRLARLADAMLVIPQNGLEPAYVKRLNRTLRQFGVPAFALSDSLEADYGLTVALVSSGVNLNDPSIGLRFQGVLKDMRVSDLHRKLVNLPTVSANLDALAELGIRPPLEELTVIARAIEPTILSPPPPNPNPSPTTATEQPVP